MIIKTYEMIDLNDWIKIKDINTPSSEEMCTCRGGISAPRFPRVLSLLDCQKINMGTNFENPHSKNFYFRVKMCSALKKSFLRETDFTATYLKVPQKSKHFSAVLACSG